MIAYSNQFKAEMDSFNEARKRAKLNFLAELAAFGILGIFTVILWFVIIDEMLACIS